MHTNKPTCHLILKTALAPDEVSRNGGCGIFFGTDCKWVIDKVMATRTLLRTPKKQFNPKSSPKQNEARAYNKIQTSFCSFFPLFISDLYPDTGCACSQKDSKQITSLTMVWDLSSCCIKNIAPGSLILKRSLEGGEFPLGYKWGEARETWPFGLRLER